MLKGGGCNTHFLHTTNKHMCVRSGEEHGETSVRLMEKYNRSYTGHLVDSSDSHNWLVNNPHADRSRPTAKVTERHPRRGKTQREFFFNVFFFLPVIQKHQHD